MHRNPSYAQRIWALRALPYGVYDAPAAFHRSLQENSSNSEKSLGKVGLRFRAPTFDPCLYFVFRDESGALGAFATHIGDIFGVAGRIPQERFESSRDIASGRRRCRRRPLCAWTWNFPSGAISRPSRPRKGLRRTCNPLSPLLNFGPLISSRCLQKPSSCAGASRAKYAG